MKFTLIKSRPKETSNELSGNLAVDRDVNQVDQKTFVLGNHLNKSAEARSEVTFKLTDPVKVAELKQPSFDPIKVLPGDPNLPIEEDFRRRFGGNLQSALGMGTVIEGRFSFDSPVRIDGMLSGEVVATSALIVGEHALVEGDVKVGSLIILGRVNGQVTAKDLVEIKSGGQLTGDIITKQLVIDEGGTFNGHCSQQPL